MPTPEDHPRGAPEGALLIPCRAILFDCDGVLVDSDASVERAWTRWAQTYGFDPRETVSAVHGRRAADSVDVLVAEDLRAEALAAINQYELDDASSTLDIPGAQALVSSLPTEIWAVVTSGTVALASARLQAAGISVPDVFVTADRVAAGKPAPDGYLAAARGLGVDPRDAVVIEDSVSGIDSGRRAAVGWVVGVGPRALGSDADVVVSDLTALTWSSEGLLAGPDGLLWQSPDSEPGSVLPRRHG